MIMPVIPEDYNRVSRNYESFFKLLPIDSIVFIGPAPLKHEIENTMRENPSLDLSFINENDLIPFDDLMDAMKRRLASEGYVMDRNSRPGWYYQQFLKMAYSRICENEYYMSWDADTIPLREIEMFNQDGRPCFDIKPEYQAGYFNTLKKLFGFGKIIGESFVSEHMLFSKKLMLEMLEELEELPLPGEPFFEKIFFAIGLEDMKLGFSEFETYGTWTAMRHNDAYGLRKWSSFRKGSCFTESSRLNDEDRKWLSKDYDSITFESYEQCDPELEAMFRNPEYREKLSPKQFYTAILESGYFGDYKDGMITTKNGSFPV